MAVYSISYDLRAPGRDYRSLIEAIKNYGDWAHPTESQWLVQTNKSASAIRDHLKNHMDANDILLVLQTGSDWASRNLPSKVADWLKAVGARA